MSITGEGPDRPPVKVGADDPQAHAREMVVEVEHPKAGKMKTLGAPVKFNGTPGGVKLAAPLLGQHSNEVADKVFYDRS